MKNPPDVMLPEALTVLAATVLASTLPTRSPTKFELVVIDPLARINPPTVTLPVAEILLAITLSLMGIALPVELYKLVLLLGSITLDILSVPCYLTAY